MRRMTGIGVSRGVAIGRVVRLPEAIEEPGPAFIDESAVEAEAARISAAIAAVTANLTARLERAQGEAKEVLDATILMVGDPSLAEEAEQMVRVERIMAARAFWVVGTRYAEMIEAAGGYLGARAADVLDVRDRVVSELLGIPMAEVPTDGDPYVLVAHDLAPADTAVLPLDKVLALVTVAGGPTSHTSIIARSLRLPAVVACAEAGELRDGDQVIVNGAGEVIIDADDTTLARARERAGAARVRSIAPPILTADGVEAHLFANVGNGVDARAAREAGATGIGLFRTELLYLDRQTPPSRDEQVEAYREVFDAFAGCKVVVRTLDAGADKPLPFLNFGHEWNPALGVRGLRTARLRLAILDDQLAAIAAAAGASTADVWVMAPMVSTPAETADFAARVRAAGLPVAGVMVEVPSAALLADRILSRCDFASIGTNDLGQYVHAADRQSADLADLNDPWQPSLLTLVQMTVAAGLRQSKPVGICGEAAADPMLAAIMLGMGVSSLSMSAAALPDVAELITRVDMATARTAATAAVSAPGPAEARAAAAQLLPGLDDGLL